MYILTITYNFNGDSAVKKCKTEKEAVKVLNKCLSKEVEAVKNESGYRPSVLDWSDDDVTLVYAEGYTKEMTDRNYALEDCAYYRVFEV